jgi:hypothetical protein
MSRSEVVIEGTLKPDGTLELDQKPSLAPGRVRVVVQPLEGVPQSATEESLWEFMQRTRRELGAAGSHFMNEEEVRDHIDWLREPDRIDADVECTGKEHQL